MMTLTSRFTHLVAAAPPAPASGGIKEPLTEAPSLPGMTPLVHAEMGLLPLDLTSVFQPAL